MAGKKFTRLEPIIDRLLMLKGALATEGIERLADVLLALATESIAARKNPRGRPWAPYVGDAGRAADLALASLRALRNEGGVRFVLGFPHAKAAQKGAKHLGRHNGKTLTKLSIRRLSAEQSKGIVRDQWKLPARAMLPGKGRSQGSIEGGTGLPPKWRDAIKTAMQAVFKENFGEAFKR